MLNYEDKLLNTDKVEIWGQIAVQRQSWNMRTNCCTQTMLKNVEKLHRQCWYKRTIFLEFLFFFSGHVLWHRIWILCKEVTDSISFLSVAIPCFCGWQKVHNLSKFSGRLQHFFVLKMMKAISVHTAAVLYVRVHWHRGWELNVQRLRIQCNSEVAILSDRGTEAGYFNL